MFITISPLTSVKISLPPETTQCHHRKAAAGALVICHKKQNYWTGSRETPAHKFHPPTFNSHQEFTLTNCCISCGEYTAITVLRPLNSQGPKLGFNMFPSSPWELWEPSHGHNNVLEMNMNVRSTLPTSRLCKKRHYSFCSDLGSWFACPKEGWP